MRVLLSINKWKTHKTKFLDKQANAKQNTVDIYTQMYVCIWYSMSAGLWPVYMVCIRIFKHLKFQIFTLKSETWRGKKIL